jgi:hypothetical protein
MFTRSAYPKSLFSAVFLLGNVLVAAASKQAQYSFFNEPYVSPSLIKQMVAPINDTGVNMGAYNLSKAQDSNQYFGPDYRLVHYPSGLEHARIRTEFYDHWVRIDLPDGTAFEYQAVHREEDGSIYLSCREYDSGSANHLAHNLVVRLEDNGSKIYQEDGTYKYQTNQKLECLRVLPSDFFLKEDRFKKMTVSFMGHFEDKYKVSLFLEPWQQRRDGIDCYAIYYITNTETMKKGYLHIGNANIEKDFLIDHLTIHESGYPVEINQDAPEFFMPVLYSPTVISSENENVLEDIGGLFNFADVDFDGKSEFIVVNNFQGQRHLDEFVVCDLEALSGEHDWEWGDLMPATLVELRRKEAPPLNYLDEWSTVDLSKKFIKTHFSGSAVDSHVVEYEWIEGAPKDGWMLARKAGSARTEDDLDDKYLSFDYKYKNTKAKDGSWNSEKVIIEEKLKSMYDD